MIRSRFSPSSLPRPSVDYNIHGNPHVVDFPFWKQLQIHIEVDIIQLKLTYTVLEIRPVRRTMTSLPKVASVCLV